MGLYHEQSLPLPLHRRHQQARRTHLGAQKRRLRRLQQKYKTHLLVYQEFFDDIESAIAREKQLKGWLRAKKIALIDKINPGWEDLAPSFENLGPSTAARRNMTNDEFKKTELPPFEVREV
jgi:predicted GIY-YIG superfamily endonuclease